MSTLPEFREDGNGESAQPLRLLVAEDEATQRLLLVRTLTRAGYQVDAAGDGRTALAMLETGDYALLVTDRDMPGLDGAALCRAVRTAGIPHYVYIIILTGQEHAVDVVSGLDSGADDYVRKSSSPAELLARLAAGARIVRLERSLRAAQLRIQLLSVTDTLLPMFNRRYLDAELEREIERTRRYGGSLALIIADLDFFKAVNDTYGHRVGDEVLLAFAGLVKTCLRVSDWAARFGGEEFVIVLPATDAAGAATVAERLRAACADCAIPTSAGAVAVTASFGVAELPHSRVGAGGAREQRDALLHAADQALYASKAGGRNRVTGG